jgi:hypothetical protein
MDPFLENPAFFPGLHDRLIAYLGEALQAQLPEPYYAEIADRLWVEVSERPIGPDIDVLRGEGGPRGTKESGDRMAAGVLSALRLKPVLVTVPHDEQREPFLQIFARAGGERLVTTIEILSLSNKTPASMGRELYIRKQSEILHSDTHLVEIDLLRGGEHTTAVPKALAVKKAGRFDYHVCAHPFDKVEDFLVYPVGLRDRLPEIAVPLLPEDVPVVLDLQAAFDRAYDAGPYRRRVRYDAEVPQPPLDSEALRWIEATLQTKGLRAT